MRTACVYTLFLFSIATSYYNSRTFTSRSSSRASPSGSDGLVLPPVPSAGKNNHRAAPRGFSSTLDPPSLSSSEFRKKDPTLLHLSAPRQRQRSRSLALLLSLVHRRLHHPPKDDCLVLPFPPLSSSKSYHRTSHTLPLPLPLVPLVKHLIVPHLLRTSNH